MNRLCLALLLTTGLVSCTLVPVAKRQVNGNGLEYAICDEGLKVPTAFRAFQGKGGWFFYDLDLEPNHPLMAQTPFMVTLAERLAAQGVQLVILPIPTRAMLNPENLDRSGALQETFEPSEAEAEYLAFTERLRAGGVIVFDTLAAARANDARGGQTFFKRDMHWRSEGARVLYGDLAARLRELEPDLPETETTLERSSIDNLHRGEFVSRWTYTHCAYALPYEAQGSYTVTKKRSGGLFDDSAPQVVLAGSSFSQPPYDYEFLAEGLQSDVLNFSVGAGGAVVALQNYLLDQSYRADKPTFLVWEFPIFAPAVTAEAQRELLGSVYGRCDAPGATVQLAQPFDTLRSVRLKPHQPVDTATSYLEIQLTDLSVLAFDLTLTYAGGAQETLKVNRSNRAPNNGLFFFTLNRALGTTFKQVRLELSPRTTGPVSVKVCSVPKNAM